MLKKQKTMLKNRAKKKPKKPRKLTEKEKSFTREYIIDKNGAGAAMRAGYSSRVAKQQACTMLQRDIVRNEVDRLLRAQAARTEINGDRVIKEIAKLAFSNIRPLFNSDGVLKDISTLDDNVSASVSSVESLEEYDGHGNQRVLVGNTKKVKMWDKPKALEMLGRHLKLFTDIVERRDGDLLLRMEEAEKRLGKAQKK